MKCVSVADGTYDVEALQLAHVVVKILNFRQAFISLKRHNETRKMLCYVHVMDIKPFH